MSRLFVSASHESIRCHKLRSFPPHNAATPGNQKRKRPHARLAHGVLGARRVLQRGLRGNSGDTHLGDGREFPLSDLWRWVHATAT